MIPYGGPVIKPPLRPSSLPTRPATLRGVVLVLLFLVPIAIAYNGMAADKDPSSYGWTAAGALAVWYAVKKLWRSRYE